jgi:hypothetical protein
LPLSMDIGAIWYKINEGINSEELAVTAFGHLLLGHRKQEDGREDNNRANPKTYRHFIHIAKKKEGHNDAIYRLKVGDKGHTKGRKLAHYRYPRNVCKRCTHRAEQEKIPKVGRFWDKETSGANGGKQVNSDP